MNSTSSDTKLTGRDIVIAAISSMEQLIGGALSTVIGVMLPMMQLVMHPAMPSWQQGIVGAMGLVGIGIGGMAIGSIIDRKGYLMMFRLCPLIIILGSLFCYLFTSVLCLSIGLLIIGIGVGGGYSLDSAYISEVLPPRWRLIMVGAAKATCSIGFIGAAVACYFMLKADPDLHTWHRMIFVVMALGALTLLMRLRWAESPKWLVDKGRIDEARKAAAFFGMPVPQAEPAAAAPAAKPQPFSVKQNWAKIIFSGIPWACEGLAVYGFSVFLPVLVMALGLSFDSASAHGVQKIIGSVEVTAVVNFFILPGFILGLCIMRRVNNVKMLNTGFLFAAIGLVLLLVAYRLHWPAWTMLCGFVLFEIALNAGPHLITFVIPPMVYPVAQRGEGSGIAAFMGKVGAVSGVVLMPIMLEIGGMDLVLIVSASVMLLGAAVGLVFGKKLKLV